MPSAAPQGGPNHGNAKGCNDRSKDDDRYEGERQAGRSGEDADEWRT